MWRKTRITITLAPHLCIPWTSWPRKTSLLMWEIEAYAVGRGRGVEHREEAPGNRLHDEGEERRRAERVEPVGPFRHLAPENRGEEARGGAPLVGPADRVHGRFQRFFAQPLVVVRPLRRVRLQILRGGLIGHATL